MTTKPTRRSKKRTARFHRMSKRQQASTLESIYSTSKRNLEVIQETWHYLAFRGAEPGGLEIVEAVLNRQMTELGYVVTRSKLLAEGLGFAVQS